MGFVEDGAGGHQQWLFVPKRDVVLFFWQLNIFEVRADHMALEATCGENRARKAMPYVLESCAAVPHQPASCIKSYFQAPHLPICLMLIGTTMKKYSTLSKVLKTAHGESRKA